MAEVFTLRSQAVGDIVVGSVLGPSSQRANESRIAMFLAGFPETVPVRTVNRCCAVTHKLAHSSLLWLRAPQKKSGISTVYTSSSRPYNDCKFVLHPVCLFVGVPLKCLHATAGSAPRGCRPLQMLRRPSRQGTTPSASARALRRCPSTRWRGRGASTLRSRRAPPPATACCPWVCIWG